MATPKLNLLIWRAFNEKLPTAKALRRRGVQIASEVCKVCGLSSESAKHVFVHCPFARLVWIQIWLWLKIPTRNHMESLKERMLDRRDWSRKKAKVIFAIYLSTTWNLWKNRNNKVFNSATTEVNKLLEEIKEETFDWISRRSKLQGVTWHEWRSFSVLDV
ncbi:putative reverse transcriptase zinc-binding domain-containing protein [Helianthus annuus]|uniref:Reverse transcriptase zinc-binding domain-containing protein n=1 Tax=Helianthus annuus TaxID=4232 RepID=A0A9K3P2U1_HELAN|nr:uncharacterized protein LOC110941257 [Helianthus annuus]KAF5820253.1 putative reverse transcriptase zinc-binding domain-containing protein [Helianthus annuus]